MLRFVSRRLLEMLLALLGTSVVVFLLIHLIPGDPALLMAGLDASPEVIEQIRVQLGLRDPLPIQFLRFLRNVGAGELGTSIRTGTPVLNEILERSPHTFVIASAATILATILGLASGVVAAVNHNRKTDSSVMVLSLLAASTPSYWLALMLMLLFSLTLRWLPSIGVGTLWHYLLPVVTLGTQSAGMISRITRGAMLDVLNQEYVRAANARGLRRWFVVVRYGLANALIPVISIVGLRFGRLLSGTVLVESVFAIPGLGRLLVDAVVTRDYPMVQGAMLVVAAAFVVVNTATDLVYAIADPRIRVVKES